MKFIGISMKISKLFIATSFSVCVSLSRRHLLQSKVRLRGTKLFTSNSEPYIEIYKSNLQRRQLLEEELSQYSKRLLEISLMSYKFSNIREEEILVKDLLIKVESRLKDLNVEQNQLLNICSQLTKKSLLSSQNKDNSLQNNKENNSLQNNKENSLLTPPLVNAQSNVPITKQIYVDNSGSTHNSQNYWEFVNNLAQNNKDANFFRWNTKCSAITFDILSDNAKSMKGDQGTDPSCVAQIAPLNGDIIIVTDGEVGASVVRECDAILLGREFHSVEVHLIGHPDSINLSVSAPFTRRTKFKIFLNAELLAKGDSTLPIDLKKYYDNPELFLQEAEQLLQQVSLQNVGLLNKSLRDEFLNLQKNLIFYLSTVENTDIDIFSIIRSQLESKMYTESLASLQTAIEGSDVSQAKRVEVAIRELINACSNSNDFSFSTITPGRLSRAFAVKQTLPDQLEPSVFDSDNKHDENVLELFNERIKEMYSSDCPTINDSNDNDNAQMLLIKAGKPIFEDLDKNYLESLLTNPLLVLNNPVLIKRLQERFSSVADLSLAKTAFEMGRLFWVPAIAKFSPRILSPSDLSEVISTGIYLDETGLNYKANEVTNYALADLFFGFKLVGNSDLWLSVVYFALKQHKEFITKYPDYLLFFENGLKQRMKRSRTMMTLTGLPVEPLVSAPTDIALWYCLVSPEVWNCGDKTLLADSDKNRLRYFGRTAIYLKQLVDLFEYPYDETKTAHRINKYLCFSWMMQQEKQMSKPSQWRNLIRAKTQNAVALSDATLVMLDGPSVPEGIQSVPVDWAEETKRAKVALLKDSLSSEQAPVAHVESMRVSDDSNNYDDDDDDYDDNSKDYDVDYNDSDVMAVKEENSVEKSILPPKKILTKLPDFISSIALDEVSALELLVNRLQKTNVVPIPDALALLPVPPPTVNYGYNYSAENLSFIPEISALTMRPFYIDRTNLKQWDVSARDLHGPLERQISLLHHFSAFICTHKKYPTKEELLLDCVRIERSRGKNTLPSHIITLIDIMYFKYERICGKNFEDVSAEEFHRRASQSLTKEQRAVIDGSNELWLKLGLETKT